MCCGLAPCSTALSSCRVFHALSIKRRVKLSAPGEGSYTETSSPRARKLAAQLAPIVPAPMTAARCRFIADLVAESNGNRPSVPHQHCALATRDRAGSAAAPAARCKNLRRGSLISILPSLVSLFDYLVGAGE